MMISCGAAAFTLRIALRQLGRVPRTRLFPDPCTARASGAAVLG